MEKTISSNISNAEIKNILMAAQNIAIVGLSETPGKPSYRVAKYLISAGYHIYPVNPKYETILGQKCYPDLHDIEDKIDIVNIFRRPEYILPVVEQAIEIGSPVVWMQLGIVNKPAAEIAQDAGLQVIMDKCIKIEHQHLIP